MTDAPAPVDISPEAMELIVNNLAAFRKQRQNPIQTVAPFLFDDAEKMEALLRALRLQLTAVTADRDATAELAGSCAEEVLSLRNDLTAAEKRAQELEYASEVAIGHIDNERYGAARARLMTARYAAEDAK